MTTAENWFKTGDEFRTLCLDAQSQARSERSQEFAGSMMAKCKETGLKTPLSEAQLKWLCQLADWILPLRRKEII